MPKKWGTLLFGTFGLILLATGLVAVIHSIKSPTTSTSDIRARASAGQALKFNATIASIDEASGTIIVENVYMADVSRSGEVKNFGTWTVTVPIKLNIMSLTPGMNVVIAADAKTFLASKRSVNALSITPGTQ